MQPGTAMCFLNFYTLVFWTPLLATGWGSTTIAPMIGLFGATYLAAGQSPLLQRLATVVPLQIGPGAEQQEAKELLQASKKREEAM